MFEVNLKSSITNIPYIEKVDLEFFSTWYEEYTSKDRKFVKITIVDENNIETEIQPKEIKDVKGGNYYLNYLFDINKKIKSFKVTFVKGKQPRYPSIHAISMIQKKFFK